MRADVPLVIAGTRYPGIFAEAGGSEHPLIRFTGFIDEADKALLYQHALAFIYPSFYEGFGLPILEAMQCGAPVITSDVTAMPEVAGGAAHLFSPNHPEQLKMAMHKLYRDEVYREQLRELGFARAREFSWKKAAGELLSVFESTCSSLCNPTRKS